MTNLQLIDTINGGHFVFKQNDYILDEGIYSELYCALFSTKSAEWLGDKAFNNEDYKISSKTENAIITYSTFTESNVNLIKKAVQSDLDRFKIKNPVIEIKELLVTTLSSNRLLIAIEIEGNTTAYQFIVQKTEISLNNISDL